VLKKKRIPHKIFVHKNPPRTLEQAAKERGQQPEQVVRSILFRISEGDFVMVLMAGNRQINWKTLRTTLGKSRVTTASVEEVKEATGYEIGAVAPFGLQKKIQIFIDESVTEQEIISMGSGVVGTAIILNSRDLMKALGEVRTETFGVL
jgi:Cys-tRNA(Pro) deacylase